MLIKTMICWGLGHQWVDLKVFPNEWGDGYLEGKMCKRCRVIRYLFEVEQPEVPDD